MYKFGPYIGSLAACLVCLPLSIYSQHANAWFIFLPLGAIARALEKDPDAISVSTHDRLVGKCLGYHTNQTMVGTKSAAEMSFHQTMAQAVLEKAAQRDEVKTLGDAYSTKWGRAAEVGRDTNLAYGRDLALACTTLNVPFSLAGQMAQQERIKREEESRRAEEIARQVKEATQREDENRKLTEKPHQPIAQAEAAAIGQIDFNSEARKAGRILGCKTTDPKVVAAEGSNIVFAMICDEGGTLVVVCDPTGLCLKK
jgi:hypothetical protein